MRQFIRGCFALALILLLTSPADCMELTTYMAVSGGVAMAEDADMTDSTLPGTKANVEYDPGYFVSLAFGNHVDKIRFEAEIGYQKNKVDSAKLNIGGVTFSAVPASDTEIRLTTLMFNLYYDFKNGSRFTPYLSAGLGLGNIKLDGVDKSDAVGEYQVGAGVAVQISERIALDLKGRYLGTTDAEFGTTNLDFTTINAILDVRIYF